MDASLDLSHFWTPELQASIDEYAHQIGLNDTLPTLDEPCDVCGEFLNYEGSVPRGFAAFANKPNAFASPAIVNNAHPPLNLFAQPNLASAPVASSSVSAATSTGPSDFHFSFADSDTFFNPLIEQQNHANPNLAQRPILPATQRRSSQEVGHDAAPDGKRKRTVSSFAPTAASKKAIKSRSASKTCKADPVRSAKKSSGRKKTQPASARGSKQHAPAGGDNLTPTGSRTNAEVIDLTADDDEKGTSTESSHPLPSSSSSMGSSPTSTSPSLASSPPASVAKVEFTDDGWAPPYAHFQPLPAGTRFVHASNQHLYPPPLFPGQAHLSIMTPNNKRHLSGMQLLNPNLPATRPLETIPVHVFTREELLKYRDNFRKVDRRTPWPLVVVRFHNRDRLLGQCYDWGWGPTRIEIVRTAKEQGFEVADWFFESSM